MEVLLEFARWYLTGALFTLATVLVHMVRDGNILRKDIVMTVVLGFLLWPAGLLAFIVFTLDKIDMDKPVWQSKEHKDEEAKVYRYRSEDE